MTKTASQLPEAQLAQRKQPALRPLFIKHPTDPSPIKALRRDLKPATISLEDFCVNPVAAVERLHPGVILSSYSESAEDGYEQIRTHFDEAFRPLLAFFTQPALADSVSADLVLPTELPMLTAMLRWAWEQRHARQAAENALAQAQRELAEQRTMATEYSLLKDAFTATVSHEFRSPLMKVKSAVNAIAHQLPNDSSVKFAMQSIEELQSKIVSVTQLGQGLDVKLEPTPINYAVDYALNELRRSEQYQPEIARIIVQQDTTLPYVEADARAIGTVLHRLLENALKFSQKSVDLVITSLDDRVRFTVRDFGIGIPQEQIEHIWDDFYQYDTANNKRYYGLGVGLSIVRLILDRHHTRIEVTSRLKHGTTFTFDLPIYHPPRTKRSRA